MYWRMTFTLAPDLEAIVRSGVFWLEGNIVVDLDLRLDGPLARAEIATRVNPRETNVIVRTMYKRIGIDPTKRRSSSEALLRRVHRRYAVRLNSLAVGGLR